MEEASPTKRKPSIASSTPTDINALDNQRQNGYRSKKPLYWFAGVPTDYQLPTKTALSVETQELQNINSPVSDENSDGDHEKDLVKVITARTIFDGFSNFTTSHGIPHVYFSTGIVKRVAWSILSLASVIFLFVHLTYLSQEYSSYQTSTKIDILAARKLKFPAVTICNNNAIKQSVAQSVYHQSVLSIYERAEQGFENDTESFVSFRDAYMEAAEYIALQNDDIKFDLGYTKEEMIISCSFDGVRCHPGDFWWFYDSNYGNCYTFNSHNVKNAKRYKSSLAGPDHGLSLVINIGSYDYIPFLTETAGVQVVVHNPSVMPFPEYNGISAAVGHLSNIGLTKTVTKRLDGKYGNCTMRNINEDNMYAIPFNVNYSMWACLRTCYQKELVRQCKCYDAELPYNSTSIVFSQLPVVKRPCQHTDESDFGCVETVTRQFENRALKCKNCTQPCREELYIGSLSTAAFPAMPYMEQFKKRLRRISSDVFRVLQDQSKSVNISNEVIQTNFLKLNIYYQMMGYTQYEAIPSYETFQFISDLGGTVGLWIGWSALTLFEFLGFIADLITYWCYKSGKCQ